MCAIRGSLTITMSIPSEARFSVGIENSCPVQGRRTVQASLRFSTKDAFCLQERGNRFPLREALRYWRGCVHLAVA
jgi:hypothetical protein